MSSRKLFFQWAMCPLSTLSLIGFSLQASEVSWHLVLVHQASLATNMSRHPAHRPTGLLYAYIKPYQRALLSHDPP
jgi:hypothetical protein